MPKPRPLPSSPSTNPEIQALRELEAKIQAFSIRLDRLWTLGARLGFGTEELKKASEAIDTYLPMFEIAAKEEGLEL